MPIWSLVLVYVNSRGSRKRVWLFKWQREEGSIRAGPLGAMQAGADLTVFGTPTEPDRALTQQKMSKVMMLLKAASPAGAVYFITFPTNARDNSEIGSSFSLYRRYLVTRVGLRIESGT